MSCPDEGSMCASQIELLVFQPNFAWLKGAKAFHMASKAAWSPESVMALANGKKK